jgi:type I restriction enzyme M protein
MKGLGKKEALSVSRLINEVLVGQLSIPFRQIVNDTTFQKYTGSKRPDLLISEYEYDKTNDDQFIQNLIAYAEVKDNSCTVGDADWKDGVDQGKLKAEKLGLPYFIVTNCKTSIFYNASTLAEITLNKNPIREFQTIDILRLLKNRIAKSPNLSSIQTNVDSISTISEAIFNKKLWELAIVYRGINFKDTQQKIDFTIGFVSLEFFEEKAVLENTKDKTKIYWSDCLDANDEKLVANIDSYIRRLAKDTDFKEFKNLIDALRFAIIGNGQSPLVSKEDVRRIYEIVDSMRPLHGAGFDLFGAVYEMFASSKEKKEFGEYFTRRHYAHLLAKLLLRDKKFWNKDQQFTILDPACGTGGFLTEGFKVLKNSYDRSGTFSADTKNFLEDRCFYGIDVRDDNISRTRLNMFLVGDGHTNMRRANSLKPKEYPFKISEFDYVITNPPYGYGTIRADTSAISTVRTEIAFLCRIRQLLRAGGHACVIQPDGVLENPSYTEFRRELLRTFDLTTVVSLPKFAFAPYTKEKTYALFLTRHAEKVTKIQDEPIWMYIIDNDGLANSDKRFPTKLRNNRNGWMHDEISGWVSTEGDEMPGILEERWLKFDDLKTDGTEWLDEKSIIRKLHKGGFLDIQTILKDKYITLLPEYYLRPYEPKYIVLADLEKEVNDIKAMIEDIQL